MFIRLGVTNVIRQLERSLLILLSLVLAAISLTVSISTNLGYPAQAFANYRAYLGGDIIVYPLAIMSNPKMEQPLELYRLPGADEFSTLTTFYPHIVQQGYLAKQPPQLQPISAATQQQLLQHPKVKEVIPLYRMPGWRQLAPSTSCKISLRSVDAESSLWEYVTSAATPIADDTLPIWVNAKLDSAQQPVPASGEKIDLAIPRLFLAPDGSLQMDASQLTTVTATVAGHYQLPTRVLSWPDPSGEGFLSEQGYFSLDEVWLSPASWQQLWQAAAGTLPPAAGSLALRVYDLSILEAVTSELQVNYPQWTIVSAPNLAKLSEERALIDSFQIAPEQYWADVPSKPQHAFPLDMSRIFAVLIYLNAGLLMAARMLTGAAARRQEIGVLKALGARRRDILAMALTEAVVLSIIGSTIGFFLAYPAACWQQISNHVPWAQILALAIKNYSLILSQTILIGIVFGMLPAQRLSKLTVNEVLRA